MVFGTWLVVIGLMAGGFALAAIRHTPALSLVALWTAAIAGVGAWSMSTHVDVEADGDMTFRGLVQERTWNVARLRQIRPGNACLVFRFDDGTAMLAWGGDRSDLIDRLRRSTR